MKDFIRKFRVQFLSHDGITAEQNCELCVKQLGRFIDIVPNQPNADLNSSSLNSSLPYSVQLDSLQSSYSTSFIDSSANIYQQQSQFKSGASDSMEYSLKNLTKVKPTLTAFNFLGVVISASSKFSNLPI